MFKSILVMILMLLSAHMVLADDAVPVEHKSSGHKVDLQSDGILIKHALCLESDQKHKDDVYPCLYVVHDKVLYVTLIDKDGEFLQSMFLPYYVIHKHTLHERYKFFITWLRDVGPVKVIYPFDTHEAHR